VGENVIAIVRLVMRLMLQLILMQLPGVSVTCLATVLLFVLPAALPAVMSLHAPRSTVTVRDCPVAFPLCASGGTFYTMYIHCVKDYTSTLLAASATNVDSDAKLYLSVPQKSCNCGCV
jgi:hypothetical protein